MPTTQHPDHWRIDEPAPGTPGRVTDTDGRCRAIALNANPLETPAAVERPDDGVAVIAWTGWFGVPDEQGVIPLDPRVWSDTGWAAFQAACDAIAAKTDAGRGVWFRPHARHVLGDAQRCRVAARAWADQGLRFGLLLEPAALLTASMLDAAADHVARTIEALGDSPALVGIVVSDIELIERDAEPGPAARTVPFGLGAIGPELFAEGLRLAGGVPAGVPLFAHAGAAPEALAALPPGPASPR